MTTKSKIQSIQRLAESGTRSMQYRVMQISSE